MCTGQSSWEAASQSLTRRPGPELSVSVLVLSLGNAPLAGRRSERVRQDLYGVVPLQHQVNANFLRNGYGVIWTGISNQFGYTRGQTVPLQLRHVALYFGSKGVRLYSLTVEDDPVVRDQWFPSIVRFGGI